MEWEILYYTTERGSCPVMEFIDGLPIKHQAKCFSYLQALEVFGPDLTANYGKKIDEDLWELRPEYGGIEYRFFYSFATANRIFVVHAIKKKDQKLKPADMQLANRRIKAMKEANV